MNNSHKSTQRILLSLSSPHHSGHRVPSQSTSTYPSNTVGFSVCAKWQVLLALHNSAKRVFAISPFISLIKPKGFSVRSSTTWRKAIKASAAQHLLCLLILCVRVKIINKHYSKKMRSCASHTRKKDV